MDLGDGTFKAKKSTLSLDLKASTTTSPVHSHSLTPDQVFTDEVIKAQKQYTQGFIDALNMLQRANKFEFGVTSPTSLPLVSTTPAELVSPLLTPATTRDMRAIMLGLLGTPINAPGNAQQLPSPGTLAQMPDSIGRSGQRSLDSASLLSLAAAALPGPPISATTSAATSPTMLPLFGCGGQQLTPTKNCSLPSTSRPDKLNFTPSQVKVESVDDSDASDINSRSSSSAPSSHRIDELSFALLAASRPPIPNVHCRASPTLPPQLADLRPADEPGCYTAFHEMHHWYPQTHGQHVGHPTGQHQGYVAHPDFSGYSSSVDSHMMSMDEQERKKLERKRARNRQAASKCRQKKMDRINELEQQVAQEKHRTQRLDLELEKLQQALVDLHNTVNSHSARGCPTAQNSQLPF